MIRLETSKRHGIDNNQGEAISTFLLNTIRALQRKHPRVLSRTQPSALYNCHGFTFANRRTRIDKNASLRTILEDDRYEEIDISHVIAGDVILYYSETGDPNHSGIVVEVRSDLKLPIVCSKWGSAGEFVHAMMDCPDAYGPQVKFYRCRL